MAGRRSESRSITLADVAREAGVAPMTVSRYLNQHPNISDKTARKVSAAIKRLGYSPNLAARMLMGQPSNAIGLIVPNLADVFFAEVAHHVQEVARERGILVWVAASNSDPTTEASLIEQMKHHRVDGILLIPSAESISFRPAEGGPPVVTIDRPLKGAPTDTVLVENRRSSCEAVEHLIGHGRKRIVCISVDSPELYTIHERIGGYEDAMRRHRLKPEILSSRRTADAIRQALLAPQGKGRPIEAIFTTNNVTTVAVMEALYEIGISVPKDMALIGFDDFELAAFLRPSITVIRQPAAELGRQAAHLLFTRIAAEAPSPGISVSLPAALILRRSCGCRPAKAFASARQRTPDALPAI